MCSEGEKSMTKLSEVHLAECDRKKKYCLCDLDQARNEGQESKLSEDFIDMIEETARKETLEEVITISQKMAIKCRRKTPCLYCQFCDELYEALKSKEAKK
jgi:hypothetical protein